MNRTIRHLALGALAVALWPRPGLPQSYSVAQAQALIKTQDWNRVLEYAQAWVHAEPKNPDAWFLVGRTYGSKSYHIGLEQPANAAPALEQAVALKPNWPEAWHALGITQQELGQWDQSVASLEHAVQLAPDRVLYWHSACESYMRLRRYDQANRAVQNMERQARTFNDWFLVGNAYFALAPWTQPATYNQKANAAYRRALQINERSGAAWTNLGTTEQALGNLQTALADYQKGARLGDATGASDYQALTQDFQACTQRREAIAAHGTSGLDLMAYNQQCGGMTGTLQGH